VRNRVNQVAHKFVFVVPHRYVRRTLGEPVRYHGKLKLLLAVNGVGDRRLADAHSDFCGQLR